MKTEWQPGTRFKEMPRSGSPHAGIWQHLGWSIVEVGAGHSILEWTPTEDHSFRAGDVWIVHGGMITALLDTAMGQATWSLLNEGEVFLTSDLRTEFYRPTTPGLIRAHGRVVHKTRRVTFAAADLYDGNGKMLASCRATNQTLAARPSQTDASAASAG
ncbi:MAG: PaaI family thioesterase [Actinomycetota bacterium]|nr:PaaI family thioesterase [Actinomycetota bacterium]